MPTTTNWIAQSFQAEKKGQKKEGVDFGALHRQRLVDFRAEPDSIVRIEHPTNLARARQLGFKAKNGFVMARVRIRKGSGLQRRPYRGRRPKQMGVRKRTRGKSIQSMAEMRASRKFPNCEVLNSYWVGEDGKNKFFEVILVDTAAPEILADPTIRWIASSKQHGRVDRGLTGIGKKGRGQRTHKKGTEKNRPSLRSHDRTAK